MPATRRGFTPIEGLVVVSIPGLLIAPIIPAVQSARDRPDASSASIISNRSVSRWRNTSRNTLYYPSARKGRCRLTPALRGSTAPSGLVGHGGHPRRPRCQTIERQKNKNLT